MDNKRAVRQTNARDKFTGRNSADKQIFVRFAKERPLRVLLWEIILSFVMARERNSEGSDNLFGDRRSISSGRFTSERNLTRCRSEKVRARTFQSAESRNPSKGNQRRTNIIAAQARELKSQRARKVFQMKMGRSGEPRGNYFTVFTKEKGKRRRFSQRSGKKLENGGRAMKMPQ